MATSKNRYPLIDLIRGLAVILMIFFHFFYDLRAFGYNQINFQRDIFWYLLPRLIVTLFLCAMGLSLPLVHLPTIQWRKFWPRFGKITLAALLISISTYILFPDRWIYFGTLHVIALCSIALLPLLAYPRVSLVLGLVILIPPLFLGLPLPWFKMQHHSMDYIPFLPWIGVPLLANYLFYKQIHQFNFMQGKISHYPTLLKLAKKTLFLGRHSFLIYLIHQPILYGGVYLFSKIP